MGCSRSSRCLRTWAYRAGIATIECAAHALSGGALAEVDDGTQYMRKRTRGLLRSALVGELTPKRIEGGAQIAEQLVGDLTHRLRLLRQ